MGAYIGDELISVFGDLVIPLLDAAESPDGLVTFLQQLGLDTTAVPGLDLTPVSTALSSISAAVSALTAIQAPQSLADIENTMSAVATAISSARTGLNALTTLSVGNDLLPAAEFIAQQLLTHLVSTWVASFYPNAFRVLTGLGVIDTVAPGIGPVVSGIPSSSAAASDADADAAVAYLPTPVLRVNTATLLRMLRDPEGALTTQLFGPATAPSGATAITQLMTALTSRFNTLAQLGLPLPLFGSDASYLAGVGDLGAAGDAIADATLVYQLPPGSSGPVVGASLMPPGSGEGSEAIVTVSGAVTADVPIGTASLSITTSGSAAAAVGTSGTVTMPEAADDLKVAVILGPASSGGAAGPLVTLGAATGTRLTLNAAQLAAAAELAGGHRAQVSVEVTADVTAVLDFSDGDSFVSDVTRAVLSSPVTVDADVTAGWGWGRGVYLHGGASVSGGNAPALSTRIPVNLDLGPVTVTALTVTLTTAAQDGQESVSVDSGLDVSLILGPLTATVTNIGLRTQLQSADGTGNLGPLDAHLSFKPPDGVGIAVDAPAVSGGGYLAVDAPNGRYLGAVALQVGTVSVQGVGVLTTRLPGGGWSLIALAEVDGLCVQLGFGIELTGVGVLVGINRSMNVTALQALARAGQLDTVLFPADLAANAPRVAADLDSLFPSAPGQYVVGPVVELAWGSASLLSAEIAIYIELPGPQRIAVLGAVQIQLPEADAPLVNLHLDLLGVIDLQLKTVSLDLSLSHSTLAGMPLTGQAALRAAWGDNPAFLLAIGGVNPNFVPPAGFPALQRIGLLLGSGNLTLRLSSYLALSTNTLQFGCSADLRAAAGPAALTAILSFDALLQFRPFHLELDLSIHAAITLYGDALMALDIDAHLTGPGPWQISGSVRFHVLFCSFTIPISGTFGTVSPAIIASVVNVLPPLAQAIGDIGNWNLSAPPNSAAVMLRGGVAGTAIHPLGGLTLQQRVVPLEQPIDRFGADLLAETTTLSVTVSIPGAAAGDVLASSAADGITGLFAPAQFISMPDAQLLTAPSFEPLTSGLNVTAAGVAIATVDGNSADHPTSAAIYQPSTRDWDTTVIDASASGSADGIPAAGEPPSPPPVTVPAWLIGTQLQSAAAAAGAAAAYPTPEQPFGLPAPRSPEYTYLTGDPAEPLAVVTHPDGTQGWFAAQASASTTAGTGIVIRYPSEIPAKQAGAPSSG